MPPRTAGCDDPHVKTSLVRGLSASLLVALGASLALGCGGGSVKAETRVGGEVEVFDFDRPAAEDKIATNGKTDSQQQKTMASLSAEGTSNARAADAPLLGARHDVRLGPNVTDAKCQCLAVSVGGPTAPGLTWSGPTPKIDAQTQLVIGLGSEGIACANNPKEEVASYKGYAQDGADIVVTVEAAQSGRPVTHGAIIPKPATGGQVYVRPAGKKVPFGRALAGGGERCALGTGG